MDFLAAGHPRVLVMEWRELLSTLEYVFPKELQKIESNIIGAQNI